MGIRYNQAASWTLMVTCCLLTIGTSGQQAPDKTTGGTPLLIYVPQDYSATAKKFPLLLCLHGAGDVGDDLNELITSNDVTPAKLIHEGAWDTSLPFIVASPQLPTGVEYPAGRPGWSPQRILDVIQYMQSWYRVDEQRIYVTGLSMGARGTWDFASAYPDIPAAIIPISGLTNISDACNLKDIPIWAFQGSNDSVVEPKNSIDMVSAINNCSPHGKYSPHLTMLHAQRHEGWSNVYNLSSGYDIYRWLLQFSKNDLANKPPLVTASKSIRLASTEKPTWLSAESFDSDGHTKSVVWSQMSGPAMVIAHPSNNLVSLDKMEIGQYELRIAVQDNDDAISAEKMSIAVYDPDTFSGGIVTSFNIAGNGTSIGQTGFMADDGSTINVHATTTGPVKSVRFGINENQNLRIDNTLPYNLVDGGWKTGTGRYVICATPYTETDGKGDEGISFCSTIDVGDGSEIVSTVDSDDGKVAVYPNPSAGRFFVKFPDPDPDTDYTIQDTTGRIMAEGKLVGSSHVMEVDQRGLPTGLYLISLTTRKSPVVIKLLIVH